MSAQQFSKLGRCLAVVRVFVLIKAPQWFISASRILVLLLAEPGDQNQHLSRVRGNLDMPFGSCLCRPSMRRRVPNQGGPVDTKPIALPGPGYQVSSETLLPPHCPTSTSDT